MGKKVKGGRRQILQLEEKKPPKTVSKPKGKSLIHYSDSDDDSKKSNESESSTKVQSSKDATPMDSEIADFFKEIDALTVPEELCEPSDPSPIENEPEKSDDPNSASQLEDPDLPQRKVDCSIEEPKEEISCSWQEIPDESTGYSYYWNMHTNEVTWDCPEEYANYVQSMNAKHQAEDKSKEVNSKRAKRKKEPEKLPEGAIIPITYYGSSSSDNSSDSENESPKPPKKQKVEQPVVPRRTKASRKKDCKKSSHKTDIIGPQLPPDFQVEPSESAVYGPSLPPNYGDILTENALSESSSVSMDVSLPETPNETSLKSAKRNINAKEIGSLPLHKAVNSITQKNARAYGLKAVVDYGSFTDEDDDDESNNATSPSHTETLIPDTKVEENNPNEEIEKSVAKVKEADTEKKTVSTVVVSTKIDKPNIPTDSKGNLKKLKNLEFQPKDTKRTDVDIDSIFAAHSSYGKHGFGFGFREHSEEETEVSSPSRQERKSYRSQTDIKPMSFVKSASVLELGSLNDVTGSETAQSGVVDEVVDVESRALDIEETEDQCPSIETSEDPFEKADENNSQVNDEGHPEINEEASEGPLKATEDDLQVHSDEQAVIKKVDSSDECDDEVLEAKRDMAAEDSKRDVDDVKELGELSSSDSSSSFDLTDDLDEIDKALCEALDKKKAMNKASVPPDNPSTETKESNIDSADGKPCPKPQKSVAESQLRPKEDSASKERIIEMAAVLTDKLTFLLSNSTSTLQSLNSLYIQLQTRLVDWQASALDSVYFEARLKEVDTYLHQYETGVVSGNWACQWDRANKRYFYSNINTHVTQWTFPDELLCQASPASVSPKVDHTNMTDKSGPLKVVSSNEDCKGVASPPPPPPGVDSPPPPLPPSSPPPPSTPPIPPQSVMEREPEDMDLEDSSDSNLPGMSSLQTFVQTNAGVFSSVSSPTTKQETLFPILGTNDNVKPKTGNIFGPEFATSIHLTVPTGPKEDILTAVSSSSEASAVPEAGSTQQKASTKSAKKKKTKIQPGLGLRKKNIPSLVEKWQKIKEEQEREASNSNEPQPPF